MTEAGVRIAQAGRQGGQMDIKWQKQGQPRTRKHELEPMRTD